MIKEDKYVHSTWQIFSLWRLVELILSTELKGGVTQGKRTAEQVNTWRGSFVNDLVCQYSELERTSFAVFSC